MKNLSDDKPEPRKPPALLEKPRTIKLLWFLLYTICGLTVLAELFIERHPHFAADRIFGFYALLGFGACAILIVAAKGIGLWLKRGEDYYDA
jgi:membrane protease YdiL (CAAX protease family)